MKRIGRLARRLIGPWGRRVMLLLAVAVAWAAWMVLPPRPLAEWIASEDALADNAFPSTTWRAFRSPTGDRLVTVGIFGGLGGDFEHGFCLWDLNTGRQLAAADDVPWGFENAFTADGLRLVTCGEGDTFSIWDTADGRLVTRLPEVPQDQRSQTAFSPEGRWFARTCEHWDGLFGPPNWLIVEIGLRGLRAAAGRWNENDDPPAVEVWRLTDGWRHATLLGALGPMAFSPDGRTLATAGGARWNLDRVQFWDVATGRPLQAWRDPDLVWLNTLTFSPDGRWLAAGLRADSGGAKPRPAAVKLWNCAAGKPENLPSVPPADDNRYVLPEFSPDGRLLTLDQGDRLRLWDMTANPLRSRASLTHGSWPFTIPVPLWSRFPALHAPRGTRALVPETDRARAALVIYDIGPDPPRVVGRLSGAFTQSPAVSPNGRLLAVGEAVNPDPPRPWEAWVEQLTGRPLPWRNSSGRVRLVDMATGADCGQVWTVAAPLWIDFDPDGQGLWTCHRAATADGLGFRNILRVQHWVVPSWRPPWWLLAITSIGLLLASVDLWLHRRVSPRAA